MTEDDIQRIVELHGNGRGGLISVLEEIQSKYSYLPREALETVAHKTGRSMVDLYGIATFYKAFSLKPRGKHLISVCLGTACHVRGAPGIIEAFEKRLKVRAGETTPDGEFTLETVNCLGACALGPTVVVDGHYFPKVATSRVADIIHMTLEGLDNIEIKTDKRIFPVEVSCHRCNHSLMDPEYFIDEYPSIRVTVSFDRMHGWLRLSSMYGSFNIASKHEIPYDTVANFFCPHCHSVLLGASCCPDCGTPMVPMIVKGGGVVEICSRRGCKGHILDVG